MGKQLYSPERIMTALAIIFVGVVLILKAFNIDTKIFFDGWWTLFLIIPGITKIFRDRNKAIGISLFVIGTSLLLAEREIVMWRNFWFVLIGGFFVAFGIRFIFPAKRQGNTQNHSRYVKSLYDFEDETDDEF